MIRLLVSFVGTRGAAVDVDDEAALLAHVGTYLGPAFAARTSGQDEREDAPGHRG